MKKVLSIALCFVLAISCMTAVALTAGAETTERYIVLLLDISDSMEENDRLTSEKDAALKFCETAAKNPNNKISIATFDISAYVNCEFTNDLETLKSTINAIEMGGGTDFTEALQLADTLLVNEAAKGISFERNIVFCSDGLPLFGETLYEGEYTSDDYYFYEYANAALAYDNTLKPTTNIYTIGFYQGLEGKEADFAPRFMADLANKMSVVTDNADELIDKFEQVAEEITKEEEPEEKVETPDSPDAPVNSTTSTTNSKTTQTVQNPSNAASVAQAIQTGTPIAFICSLTVALLAFGVIAFTAKKREN